MGQPRILLVEDDPLVGPALLRMLSRRYDVRLAHGVSEALATAREFSPQAVISDCDLGDPQSRDGLWLINQIRAPGLILTGYELDGCPYPVFRKPTAPADLMEALDGLLAPQD